MLFHFYFLLFPFEGMDLLNSRRAWALGIVGLAVCFEFCCWCEGCLDEEREALLQIKHDINYPNGSSLSDWKGDDCCQWPRVSCNNHTSRVNEIDLYEVREEDLGTWYPNATLFAQFKELFYLYLSGNQIDGWRMPEDICELRRLKALGLYRNNIKGRIHPCIGNMRSLEVLDLGYNRFEGSIPPLDNLTSLSWFYFDGNDLDGVLTFSTFANLSKLTLLNLSNNPQLQVETESPTWIPSFQLKYLYLSNCQLNQHSGGAIPSFLATQYKLETIDLSNSKLFGPFPESFKYLEQIESLDLSYNKLTGVIPPQITQLTTLGTFSVAFNNLSGALPDLKNQFITFNESSYAGNPSLCGEPLKRRCSADIPFQPKGGRTEEEKEESRIIDNPVFFYSCVAMAHALGFWIFIGLLVFNKGWRFNFFRTVDRYIYIGMCDQNLSTTWMI
ncbi:receptor-like protein 14 isoform X2 [Magnolia sinica]|uniref:receptor-like protein 14 isoform X2 n=1 Tax=Magnolia sinica TaxID=86752 RepID=UPI002657C24A|nr:receptor-like protein 14 isoform X2 [Magnolia sinica]